MKYDEAAQVFETIYKISMTLLERSGQAEIILPDYDGHDFVRLMARACDEQILPYHWPEQWRLK